MKNILGISAFYHDSAACLLQGSNLLAAAQEERFTRRKFEPGFPSNAVEFCLEQAGLRISDMDAIAFYEDPASKLERILWSLQAGMGELDRILDTWEEKTDLEGMIRRLTGFRGPILKYDHHLSHAASTYYMSGFPEAAILVNDGVGEWATTTFSYGREGEIQRLRQVDFPHSLGLFYSALTAFLGFRPNSDEYKVMGMTAYGRPRFSGLLREMLQVGESGDYSLDLRYFDYKHKMYSDQWAELLGVASRKYGEPLEQVHFDLACSGQELLEEALLKATVWLQAKTGSKNLCLAGGVALNCLANAKLRDETPFENIFVQPASGDAGGCFGAALCAARELGTLRLPLPLAHVRLGPSFSDEEIERYLRRMGLQAQKMDLAALTAHCAGLLKQGKILGWFQGRMEFGPRALGGRSILADPRVAEMKEMLNHKIKKREGFRPFAPICTEEAARDFFEVDRAYPFMTFIVQVREPERLQAISHSDGTARLQTVNRESDPLLHALLEDFGALTGIPALINTSFNVAGEPIVCSPEDAFNCFRESGIDVLVMGSFVIDRESQAPELVEPGTNAYRSLAREVEAYLKDTYFFS